jgi:hypothetical protein
MITVTAFYSSPPGMLLGAWLSLSHGSCLCCIRAAHITPAILKRRSINHASVLLRHLTCSDSCRLGLYKPRVASLAPLNMGHLLSQRE